MIAMQHTMERPLICISTRILSFALFLLVAPAAAQQMPIFDAHIHYSHDAVELVPPKAVAELLRKAGVRKLLSPALMMTAPSGYLQKRQTSWCRRSGPIAAEAIRQHGRMIPA